MTVQSLFDLRGKVAMITGGTRGLGLQMAEGLAEAGANLILVSANPQKQHDEVLRKLEHTGVNIRISKMDVTDKEGTVSTVQEAAESFGRIDICITSAGINDLHPLSPEGYESWNRILEVNATGTFLTVGAVAQQMKKQSSGGSIITVSSIYGLVGLDKSLYVDSQDDFFEFPAYHASKGAVVNFTRDAAVSLGKFSIRANCICPATFLSDQNRMILQGDVLKRIEQRTPLGRTGEQDDLKGVAVFLASDASKYITGQTLAVDGGWTAW